MITHVFHTIRNTVLFVMSEMLLIGAVIALVWANMHNASYASVSHWFHFPINEIAMTAFFAVAAKEIREAMLPQGSLSNMRTAALPLIATVGGMAGPALFYVVGAHLTNPELMRGWAIPTATDIAFAGLVARAIFGKYNGKSHPAITFLMLLAIADDAGGLAILAVFYPSDNLNLPVLALFTAAAFGYTHMVRARGYRSIWAYTPAFVLSWIAFYVGGLHPSLSAVPLMWMLPHRAQDLGVFSQAEMDEPHSKTTDTLTQMEHLLMKPIDVILLLFGFTNAGVQLTKAGTATTLVCMALMIGKPVGILLTSIVGMRLFKLKLPDGMGMRELTLVGCAAGIGFTVSLFVATVAFPAGDIQNGAKLGALMSLGSAVITWAIAHLWRRPTTTS